MKKPRSRNKIRALFALTVVLSFALVAACAAGIYFFVRDTKTEPTWTPKEREMAMSMRCGLDSLYVALQFLEKQKGVEVYREIQKDFPNVEKQGTTLAKISGYLEKRGFYTRLEKLSPSALRALKTEQILFVLKVGQPVSHVFLLWKKSDGKDVARFQFFDTAKGTVSISVEQAEKLGNHVLLVSKESLIFDNLPGTLRPHLPAIFLLCLALFLSVFFFRNISAKSKKQEPPTS